MSYYQERRERYGDDVKALGWSNEESQRLRFKALSEIADLRGATVLDFGCGFGDMSVFLPDDVSYVGYDADPEMLRVARDRYPNEQFVDRPVAADYALASGVFNLRIDWQTEVIELWNLCRRGMALNFTSALAERKTSGIVYADPFETARFCASLTRKFVLRHDYKLNDFCVYCYK